MGKLVAMVGVFGAVMAVSGSVVAMLVAGTGTFAGSDDAGVVAMRGVGAVFASIAGLAGALTARSRLTLGATLMLASSALGLILITWYYAGGAILFLAASALALRPGPGRPQSTP